MMAQLQSVMTLLARICIGIPFMIFGGALMPYWGDYTTILSQLEIPVPAVFLIIAIAFLLLGGASLILGFKTRVGSILLLIVMIAATFTTGGFTELGSGQMPPPAWVLWNNIALVGGLLYTLTYGAGSISFDHRSKSE